jgi:uncharacterized protein (DUF885 family)
MKSTLRQHFRLFLIALIVSCWSISITTAWSKVQGTQSERRQSNEGIDAGELNARQSEMRSLIERFEVDRGSLDRSFTVSISPARNTRMKQLVAEWLGTLKNLDFEKMSHDGKIDYVLFKNYLEHELRRLDLQAASLTEIEPLLPFAGTIISLEESRRRMEPLDPEKTAILLNAMGKQIDSSRKAMETEMPVKGKLPVIKKTVANRAVGTLRDLNGILSHWFNYFNGYDPMFTWWAGEPYKVVDEKLKNYSEAIRDKFVGVKADDNKAIIGDPIGREGLLAELSYEMIPYSPEELVAIANKEFSWCETEMKKASRELGYGDDWKKALEFVKTKHVDPGKQTELVRDLALEAIKFVDDHDLVTVPQLARDTWRMEMLTPEQQLVSPFFLGGEVIQVAYPTNTMGHEQKMMGMRGNNIHFSRATVFHELIPGHHLQGFMMERYRSYRGMFSTPFWVEGGALYWEMVFWDMNFPKTPENKIGMLFWRMHRCARIIFSLNFHLEKMTPQECIDFLVDRVGHERDNATAEVRRSVAGGYGPLYQCAYMLGALQLRALRKELVDTGKMTNRQFHDGILHENSIPIEMVRASLTDQKLNRDFKSNWKFYGANPAGK